MNNDHIEMKPDEQKVFVVKNKGELLKAYQFLEHIAESRSFMDVTIIFDMKEEHFTEEEVPHVANVFGVTKEVIHKGRLPFVVPRGVKVIINNVSIPLLFMSDKGATFSIIGNMEDSAIITNNGTVQLVGGTVSSIDLWNNSQLVLVSGKVKNFIKVYNNSAVLVSPSFTGKVSEILLKEQDDEGKSPSRVFLVETKFAGLANVTSNVMKILKQIFNHNFRISLGKNSRNELVMFSGDNSMISHRYDINLASDDHGFLKLTKEMLRKVIIEDGNKRLTSKEMKQLLDTGNIQVFNDNEEMLNSISSIAELLNKIAERKQNKEI